MRMDSTVRGPVLSVGHATSALRGPVLSVGQRCPWAGAACEDLHACGQCCTRAAIAVRLWPMLHLCGQACIRAASAVCGTFDAWLSPWGHSSRLLLSQNCGQSERADPLQNESKAAQAVDRTSSRGGTLTASKSSDPSSLRPRMNHVSSKQMFCSRVCIMSPASTALTNVGLNWLDATKLY